MEPFLSDQRFIITCMHKPLFVLLVCLLGSIGVLHCEELPAKELLAEKSIVQTKLLAESNRLVLAVNGMCCRNCAIGIGKKVAEVGNVDTKALPKGIIIDREHGLLTVAVKEGAKIEYSKLFDAIRKAGYDPVRLYQMGVNNSLVMTQI